MNRFSLVLTCIVRQMSDDLFGTLLLLVGYCMFLTIVNDSFLGVNMVLVEQLTQLTVYDLRTQIYRRSLDMDLAVFQRDGAAGLMSRLTHDVHCLALGFRAVWGKCLREPFKAAACLIGA